MDDHTRIVRDISFHQVFALDGQCHHVAAQVKVPSLVMYHVLDVGVQGTALAAELPGCANAHFDAAEHRDGIVFLHAVADVVAHLVRLGLLETQDEELREHLVALGLLDVELDR